MPVEDTELWEALPDEQKLWPVFSYSQIQKFIRCKFQWYISYFLGYESPTKTYALDAGDLVHKGLASFYTHKMVGMSAADWKAEYMPQLVTGWLNSDHNPTAVNTAVFVLDRYLMECEEFDRTHSIKAVEHHFLFPLETPSGEPFLLQGYIDLLTTDPQGNWWLWDHKTGAQFWSEMMFMLEPQFPTYGGALKVVEGIDVFGYVLNQLKTYDYKKKEEVLNSQLFERKYFARSQQEVSAIMDQILYVVEDMIFTRRHLETQGGQPIRSMTRECGKFCNVADPCLSALKGIPVEVVLEDSFRKKEGHSSKAPEISVLGY